MFYTIYQITNKINGKIYIGAHKTDNLEDDYFGSGKYLHRAIKKYGIENFEKGYIAIFDNQKEMFQMESKLVNEDLIKSGKSYNLVSGGKGGFDYINKSGFSIGFDYINKNGLNAPKKLEALKVVNERLKTDPVFRAMVIKKRQENNKGFLGKKHSVKTKSKISKKNSVSLKGKKNPMYGMIWIFNEKLKKNTRVLKSELNEWMAQGWTKGRKINLFNNKERQANS